MSVTWTETAADQLQAIRDYLPWSALATPKRWPVELLLERRRWRANLQ